MTRKICFLIIFFAIFFTSSQSSELRYGKGNFSIKSDILGTSKKIKDNISVFSLAEEHKNLLGSNFYYGYNFSFLTSEKEEKILDFYNRTYDPTLGYKPQMQYRLEGFDGQVDFGFDIFKSEKGYLGFSGLLGISLPYIKNYNSNNNNSYTEKALPDSKTKLKTYRIGASLKTGYEILPRTTIFAFFSYAYQTGKAKNDSWNVDTSVNGIYFTAGAGIKIFLIKEKAKIFFIPLSPQLYLTAGYKYDRWIVKNVKINNVALTVKRDDLTITDSYGFFGIGYSF